MIARLIDWWRYVRQSWHSIRCRECGSALTDYEKIVAAGQCDSCWPTEEI